MRVVLVSCGVFAVGILLETFVQPHYSAPIVGAIILIALQSMRYLRLWQWRGLQAGRWLVFASVVLCVVSFVVFCKDAVTRAQQISREWSSQRARILERLEHDGGRHLVIVHYGPEHPSWQEWVFNDADIDSARVVWARNLGADRDRELLDYFKDRRVWVLEVNDENPELVPYLTKQTSNSVEQDVEQSKRQSDLLFPAKSRRRATARFGASLPKKNDERIPNT